MSFVGLIWLKRCEMVATTKIRIVKVIKTESIYYFELRRKRGVSNFVRIIKCYSKNIKAINIKRNIISCSYSGKKNPVKCLMCEKRVGKLSNSISYLKEVMSIEESKIEQIIMLC
jgi:hypothetical protein